MYSRNVLGDEMSRLSRYDGRDTSAGYFVMMGIVVVIIVSIPLIKSHFEMKTFNKFTTGPKATYMDALCSELRVEANRVSK